MNEPAVWTFFYGSYLNLKVLAEVDLVPSQWEKAKLNGFEITIAPRANLAESSDQCVYGINALATHSELERLYAHAHDVLGEIYLPRAVLTETLSGTFRPALCYICNAMETRPAETDYCERIAAPCREYGFPDWYIQRIESFKP